MKRDRTPARRLPLAVVAARSATVMTLVSLATRRSAPNEAGRKLMQAKAALKRLQKEAEA